MNQLKTLQEEKELKDLYVTIGGLILSCGNLYNEQGTDITSKIGEHVFKEKQKAYTLGMMKGVEMVEGVVEKEASAKHDNHEDWQDGNCDCDGVFDYSEIQHIITKLKQELK